MACHPIVYSIEMNDEKFYSTESFQNSKFEHYEDDYNTFSKIFDKVKVDPNTWLCNHGFLNWSKPKLKGIVESKLKTNFCESVPGELKMTSDFKFYTDLCLRYTAPINGAFRPNRLDRLANKRVEFFIEDLKQFFLRSHSVMTLARNADKHPNCLS